MIDFIYNNEKEVDYLFLTPYSNGANFLKNIPLGVKKMVCPSGKMDDKIAPLIQKGVKIKNILFNNVCNCSHEMRQTLKQNGVKISTYGQGWFPHSWAHFDPLGFSSKSLLAKSRLDNIEIDSEEISKKIIQYKQKSAKLEDVIHLNKRYILLIFQHTRDYTVRHDYKEFSHWQKIINFADRIRDKNDFLVVKINPQNKKDRDSIVLPRDSIAVQSRLFNNDLLANAKAVVGVNSTMLYEASLLYDKPVLALGNSWFDAHPEVVQKVNIDDENICIKTPTLEDIEYRRKMYYVMQRMQVKFVKQNKDKLISDFIKKHEEVSAMEKIEDWQE